MMKEHVTDRDSLFSVLVTSVRGKEDGFVVSSENGKEVSVRTLPITAWDAFKTEVRWKSFCGEYGSVSRKDKIQLMSLARLSRAFQGRLFRVFEHAGEIVACMSDNFRAYVKLQSAVRAKRKTPCEGFGEEDWGNEEVQKEALVNEIIPPNGNAIGYFSNQINQRTKFGRAVVWWSVRKKKFRPGLWFEHLGDALFALFAIQIDSPAGLGICDRCGKRFWRARVAQKFCSVSCGNYMRKMRERQRTKRGER